MGAAQPPSSPREIQLDHDAIGVGEEDLMQRKIGDSALAELDLLARKTRAHPIEIVAEEGDVIKIAAALARPVALAKIILQAG